MSEYQEILKKVSDPMYVCIKPEGKAAHPDWYGIGCNPAPDKGSERYNRQLNAYIKDIYGVEPDAWHGNER